MANMVSGLIVIDARTYLAAVHNENPPSSVEWAGYCTHAREGVARTKGVDFFGVSITPGGGPNATQRYEIGQVLGDIRGKTAVFTESRLIQGVVTALGWITKTQMKAYSFSDLEGGLGFVQIRPTEVAAVMSQLSRLGADITPENPIGRLWKHDAATRHGP